MSNTPRPVPLTSDSTSNTSRPFERFYKILKPLYRLCAQQGTQNDVASAFVVYSLICPVRPAPPTPRFICNRSVPLVPRLICGKPAPLIPCRAVLLVSNRDMPCLGHANAIQVEGEETNNQGLQVPAKDYQPQPLARARNPSFYSLRQHVALLFRHPGQCF